MTTSRRVMLVGLLALAGCSKGFNRGAMDAALNSGRPTFVSGKLTVEEAEHLAPQAAFPIRLAVAPPQAAYGPRWGGSTDWSTDELAEIESWEQPLRAAGVVKDLVVIPGQLVQACTPRDPSNCTLEANRVAAARVQADALLVLSLATDVDRYVNPLSMLDLTIVGCWLVPGHHKDALTIVDGVMLDNRNEYLYLFARAEGNAKLVRPVVYAQDEVVVPKARLAALQAFGRELVRQASSLKSR